MNKVFFSLLTLLAVLGTPTKLLAHMIETNYLMGAKLEFQSSYSSGEPVKRAQVFVYAPNDSTKPWMEGETDEEGRFAFLPDPSIQGDWEIQILQEGHEDYWTIPVGQNGVEFDLISQNYSNDIHYSSLPLNGLGMMTLLIGTGGAIFLSRRQ